MGINNQDLMQIFSAPHWLLSAASSQVVVIIEIGHDLSKAQPFKLSKLEEGFSSTALERRIFGEPGHSIGRGLEFGELQSTEFER